MVDRYCVGMQAYSALDYSAYKENKLVNQPTHRYTRRRLHMCCGYPNYLDEDGYKKANPETYFRLVEQLINSMIQQVSIEDAHRHNDLTLFDHFTKTSIILGSFAIADGRVESVEEIRKRLQAALEHIDIERLIAAPDCGLGFLGRNLAMRKLKYMCQVAKTL